LIPVLVNFRYNRVEKGKNLGGPKEKARKEENREEMLSRSLNFKHARKDFLRIDVGDNE